MGCTVSISAQWRGVMPRSSALATFILLFALSALPLYSQIMTSAGIADRSVISETPSGLQSDHSPAAATYRSDIGTPSTKHENLSTAIEPSSPTKLSGHDRDLAKRYDVSMIGDRDVAHGMNFYSLQKEVALGRDLAAQVEQSSKLLQDTALNEYINRLGQRLVRHSDAKVPFTIKIIDSDEVNAFALPGGFFYVDTGLILAADNEAELAAVMAHEIAHVAARHATRNATKSDMFSILSIPLVFVAGPAGVAARGVADFARPMSFLKFSRDAEREADLLGIEYAYASGYDPRAMVDLFERLESQAKKKPGFFAKAFMTHPMNAERIRRAQDEIALLLPARDSYIETTSEFDQMKARLEQLQGGHRLELLHAHDSGPVLRTHNSRNDAPASGARADGPELHTKSEDPTAAAQVEKQQSSQRP